LARKSLKIANLFRGIGHMNLNHRILDFVWNTIKKQFIKKIYFFILCSFK
jgi:hypothetical protein